MRATVIYVATNNTDKNRIAVCVVDGQEGFVVFSIQKGGPWKSSVEPKRGEQITVESLNPAGQGVWVPTSASPLPAEPPIAQIRRAVLR